MTVEPPLVKSHIDERSDRSIVVREGLGGNVESIHAWMEDRCNRINPVVKQEKNGKPVTGMSFHVSSRDEDEETKENGGHVREIVNWEW